MIDCFLGDTFGVLSYPYWSTALQCGARLQIDSHLKLLDFVLGGTSFLTGCVFRCDSAHRRSVAVLRVLYNIRCNSTHPLCGALPQRVSVKLAR